MAQSKRQRKIAARDKAEGKKFWVTVGIITALLLVLLFIIYSRAAG